jgi:threonine dehydrogenase-like Zn-dependent dehydrogenase
MRELPLPEIDADSALLRVEACGICGSDAEQYAGVLPAPWPTVLGHEPLGIIEQIGDRAAKRWGVDVGDRVAVETLIPCGHCRACIEGATRSAAVAAACSATRTCRSPPRALGRGADFMYLDPFSIVHPIRKDIPASLAVPSTDRRGIRWAGAAGDRPGDTVLILGPGQRGRRA